MLKWDDLHVMDSDGMFRGTLGQIVAEKPSSVLGIVVEDGRIGEWPGYFAYADGQDADHTIPAVDWSGFEEQLTAVLPEYDVTIINRSAQIDGVEVGIAQTMRVKAHSEHNAIQKAAHAVFGNWANLSRDKNVSPDYHQLTRTGGGGVHVYGVVSASAEIVEA